MLFVFYSPKSPTRLEKGRATMWLGPLPIAVSDWQPSPGNNGLTSRQS
jgi:hypothetical protein